MADKRASEARLEFLDCKITVCFLCKKPLKNGQPMLCFLDKPKRFAHYECSCLPLWKWFMDPSEVVEIPRRSKLNLLVTWARRLRAKGRISSSNDS